MALLKIIDKLHVQVYVWKVEEEVDYLVDGLVLRQQTQERLSKMKSEVHKKGFLAVRHLLLTAGYTDLDLLYDKNGKPYLTDGNHISISHSFEYACIIISKSVVGIDIEQKRDKIQRIATKFLSSTEKEFNTLLTSDQSIEYLTRVWCVKETLFKMGDSRSLSFKDNMRTHFSAFDSLSGQAEISSQTFNLTTDFHIEDLGSFILAYAVNL